MCAEMHVRQFRSVEGVGEEEALYIFYVPYHDFDQDVPVHQIVEV